MTTNTATSAGKPNTRRRAAGQTRGEGRKRILDAALDLFAEQGFDAVSTVDVAGAAGTSQSVVMYHFLTKEALWRAAMRLLFERVDVRHIFPAGVYSDLEPADRLKVLLRSFVEASARYPQLGRVIFREGLSGGPRLEWLVQELARPQYAAFLSVLRELQADGQIDRRLDPVALTLAIHGAGATIFNLAHLTSMLTDRSVLDERTVGEQSDLLVQAFFGGIVRPQR